ncbi:HAD family hydrolase [Actinoplanes sp. NPDC051494]|uniref:HAD family hydrolase n=1 Tax=Actinoplanes sp. NPDC051494 TaxID=3363907 RepID=UPI0037AA0C76
MTLRGVLLDLDGTLVDHQRAADAGLRAWLPTVGREPADEDVARWTTLQEPHLAAWRAGTISFAEQRRRRMRDFLGTNSADDELDALFAGYLVHYERAWRAYDDVTGALAAIAAAGLVTAVLTNGARVQQNRKLSRTGLAGRVGPVFTVEDLGAAKPDPAAFLRSCERWGLAPAEVLSVGDNHALDVVAARAAGLSAVHLDRDATGPAGEPRRMTSLLEISAFLP